MSIKTRVAVALCVPLLTIAGAGTAFAGEISGPPGADGYGTGALTPIAGYVANSICAFSGLQRFHEGKPETVWPPVQSYGMFVRLGEKDNPYLLSPGDACNGHTGELAVG
ncbi:MAG: hypothetical protein HHJ11_12080 [Phycicoccus sp.]|nr:hypothetical protein [Phycicoccus sp.]